MYNVILSHEADDFYWGRTAPEKKKLDKAFEYIQRNPRIHPNIKRLTGKLAGLHRYRAGDLRVVYRIEDTQLVVFVTNIGYRQDVYK